MGIQFNQANCKLYFSDDNGQHFSVIYDPADCLAMCVPPDPDPLYDNIRCKVATVIAGEIISISHSVITWLDTHQGIGVIGRALALRALVPDLGYCLEPLFANLRILENAQIPGLIAGNTDDFACRVRQALYVNLSETAPAITAAVITAWRNDIAALSPLVLTSLIDALIASINPVTLQNWAYLAEAEGTVSCADCPDLHFDAWSLPATLEPPDLVSGTVNTVEGTTYLVTVTGAVTLSDGTLVDAQYYSNDGWTTQAYRPGFYWKGGGPAALTPEPAYTSTHTYTFSRPGTGAPLGAGTNFYTGNYIDNTGSFIFTVDPV